MKRLVVKWRDSFCNLPISHVKRVEDVIEVYRGDDFVGMFDLGTIDSFYVTDTNGEETHR